ncbi:dihydroorotate dehydrogenase-like protein [Myxococcota bacterium]|nr:dihydroorotate dehydrogenase-like protein [Myxococcota bacterium]
MNLTTKYLGLTLKSPLVASANPLTGRLDMLKRLEDSGIAAAVLPSLFEEQLAHDEMQIHRLHESGAESFAEASLGYHPELITYNIGPDKYLDTIRLAKKSLNIPIIASLNGISPGGWVHYAKTIEEAGADALELNVYFVATDPDVSGAEVEQRYVDLVGLVKKEIKIPLAVKIGPFFSSPAHMARKLVAAGADGLVLFNRFLQPDIDLDTLTVTPNLQLSTSAELRLPLRWMAILRGRVNASLAATSGPHTADDVLKLLLAGADAVMMASAILKHGPEYIRTVEAAIARWLEEREYVSLEQMKGSMSQENSPDPQAFERANYMHALTSYTSRFEWR